MKNKPMKTGILATFLVLLTFSEAEAQIDFVIEPSQSMIMTGKGPGQDATINPFFGEDCVAVIGNIGEREFSVRIQKEGKILKEIPIYKGETKKVILEKGQELYLDPTTNGIAKARVDYEKLID